MKNLYKKISVLALAGMIVVGGIAASGLNAQAYSSNISRQVQDLGRKAAVFHEVKPVVKEANARIEAVFQSKEEMNKYVSQKYWDKIQRKNKYYKKYQEDLLVELVVMILKL